MIGAVLVTVGAAVLVIIGIGLLSDREPSTGRRQHARPASQAPAPGRYIAERADIPPAAVVEMPHAVQVWGATPAQMADRIAAKGLRGDLMTWNFSLPTQPRCGHKPCARRRMLGASLALAAIPAIIGGTHGRHLELPWLLAAAVLLAGWALAFTWPHPQLRFDEPDEDMQALIHATRECGPCETGFGWFAELPCRCTHDCGHRQCEGWYADWERAMSR